MTEGQPLQQDPAEASVLSPSAPLATLAWDCLTGKEFAEGGAIPSPAPHRPRFSAV